MLRPLRISLSRTGHRVPLWDVRLFGCIHEGSHERFKTSERGPLSKWEVCHA